MNNFLSLLGLASRARKIVTGETLIKKIRTNAIYLVIIASDASDNTKKKFIDKCTSYNVDYIVTSSREESGCFRDSGCWICKKFKRKDRRVKLWQNKTKKIKKGKNS